jgi:hypothetical protein
MTGQRLSGLLCQGVCAVAVLALLEGVVMGVVADRRSPLPADASPHHEQHPLWLAVVLHLFPGAVLTAFIIVAAAGFGVEPLLALLVGILVVLAPLERR